MDSNNHETRERQTKSSEEIFVRTDKGMLRAELIKQNESELVIRAIWAHDGKGVGNILKLNIKSLHANQTIQYCESQDNGNTFGTEKKTSGKLELITKWEKGLHITADDLIARTENHSASQALPDNQFELKIKGPWTKEILDTAEEPYRLALSEYEFKDEAKAYEKTNPSQQKFNFAFGNPDLGWKAHINVTPDNVKKVSEYLKKNGYYHKYLNGGDGSLGKAFTIYFGAKSIMDKWSPVIAQDISSALCKPIEKNEVEVTPGIVARFVANDGSNTFTQYGTNGVVIRRDFWLDKNGLNKKIPKTIEEKRIAARDAYQYLSEMYGSYFNG